MIKRILVPLDPSPYTDSALTLACLIAKQYDAEITGLVVLDIPGIEDSIGPIPIGGIHLAENLEKQKKEEARIRIEELIEKFKSKCNSKGVKHKEAERQGSPSDQILKESIYFDLVMMGLRTCFHFETSEKLCSSLNELIKESITPVYGVPENLLLSTVPDRRIKVLIAFDGSPLAARSLQCFAQLIIPDLYEITLLISSDSKEAGEYILSHAEEYLNAHNIVDVKKEWVNEDIIDVIKDYYYDKMDAFVVGAHSREGVFDFLVGSLTKYLIKTAEKPVFIGQ